MSQGAPWGPPSLPPVPVEVSAAPVAPPGTSPGAWVLLAAALGLVVGALLPWAELAVRLGPGLTTSVAGTEGDGVLTLLLGIVVGLTAVLAFLRPSQARWAGLLAVVAGGAVVGVAVVDIVDVQRVAGDRRLVGFVEVSVGLGLWTTLVAGIVALAGGVLVLLRPQT